MYVYIVIYFVLNFLFCLVLVGAWLMNLFKPAKKVPKVYFRFGENQFVLLAVFIFAAHKNNWTKEEIKMVVDEARKSDYEHFIKTLRDHS